MPVPSRQIVKEALLVGVSYETNDILSSNGFPIQAGAHKDTMNLRKLLIKRYGYEGRDITTLIDSKDVPYESWPTRENIINAMKNLVRGKEPGDHIVFSFSGHGGQVSALVDQYEIDGKDEILLPVDSKVNPTVDSLSQDYFVDFIRDDEIRDILVNQLPDGVRCTMIFDCCHSGTASDLPIVDPSSPIGTPDSPLFSPPLARPRTTGAFAQMTTLHDGHAYSAPYMWPAASGLSYFENEVTSWSACLDDQLTFGRKSGGIFMKAFTDVLQSTPNPTHRDLLRYLRKRLIEVTEEANQKLQEHRKLDAFSRGEDVLDDYVPPRPQLGSLRPDSILHATFNL